MYVKQSLDKRKDLAAIRAEIQAAQSRVAAARSAHKPSINIVASSNWYDDKLGLANNSSSIMGVLSFDLYDGQRDGKIDAAMAQQRETQWRYQALEQTVQKQVRDAYNALVESKARLAIAENNVAVAKRAVTLVNQTLRRRPYHSAGFVAVGKTVYRRTHGTVDCEDESSAGRGGFAVSGRHFKLADRGCKMNRAILSSLAFAVLLSAGSNLYAADAGNDRGLPVIESHVITLDVKPESTKPVWIPQSLLVSRDAVPGVFVLENNQARFRMVLPGKRSGAKVEILSGLFGNETLLSDDLAAMHDGSPVKIIE